jgi:hypothetical protein
MSDNSGLTRGVFMRLSVWPPDAADARGGPCLSASQATVKPGWREVRSLQLRWVPWARALWCLVICPCGSGATWPILIPQIEKRSKCPGSGSQSNRTRWFAP